MAYKPSATTVLFESIRLGYVVYIRNYQRNNRLIKELNEHLALRGLKLSPDREKRIRYYSLQSAVEKWHFLLLRGYRASREETQRAVYFGAFTTVADDLMDQNDYTFDQLLKGEVEESVDSVLFQYLLKKIQPFLDSNENFARYFRIAHEAQNVSLKQVRPDPLSKEELQKISFDKGGYYTLLYRTLLEHPFKEGEEEAIYTLGTLYQLVNDFIDIHKDTLNSTQTLVTNTKDYHYLGELYQEQCRAFEKAFMDLDYPMRNKKRSYASISLITSRGAIAWHQYTKLQGDNPQIDVDAFTRSQLIVDMEKPSNLWLNLVLARKMLDFRNQG